MTDGEYNSLTVVKIRKFIEKIRNQSPEPWVYAKKEDMLLSDEEWKIWEDFFPNDEAKFLFDIHENFLDKLFGTRV